MQRDERLRHVGPGGRELRRADLVIRRSCPDRVGEGEGELVQEVRVRRGEVEGDRVGLVVGDDAAREIAATRRPLALVGADDAGVVTGRAGVDGEQALDRVAEVFGLDRCPVRVPDAGAEAEGVGPAASAGAGSAVARSGTRVLPAGPPVRR